MNSSIHKFNILKEVPGFICLVLILCLGCFQPLIGSELTEKYCEKGSQFMKAGNLKAAEAEFNKVLSLAPDHLRANYYIYRIERKRGNVFKAFDSFREVLALEPSYRNSDRVFQEFVPSLLPEIKKRLSENRKDAKAQQMLGFVLVHANRISEGIKKLHYANELAPLDALIYDDLAWGYCKLKMFDKALNYSAKAFNLAAELPSVSSHYKKLFYIKKFGQKVVRADQSADFYPPPRTVSIAAVPSQKTGDITNVDGVTEAPGTDVAVIATDTAGKADTTGKTDTAGKTDTTGKTDAANGSGSNSGFDEANAFRTGDALVQFVDVDVDDDQLMGQLMAAVKTTGETTSVSDGGDNGEGAAVIDGAVTEPDKDNGPVSVPSPVATLKKLNAAYSEGERHLSLGNFELAEKSFSFVKQLQPDFRNVGSLYKKAESLAMASENLAKGKDLLASAAYGPALEAFNKVGEKQLKQISSLKSLDHLVGECLYKQNKFPAAAKKFENWLKLNPNDYRYQYMLGKCYYEQGDHQGAYEQISAVKANAPDIMAEFSGSGTLYVKIFIKKSILYIALAAGLWMFCLVGYVVFKAKGHSDASQFKEAFAGINTNVRDEQWDKVLEICEAVSPKSMGKVEKFRIDFARTQAYLGKGRLEKAREICEVLLAEFSEDQMTHNLYAKILLATGEASDSAVLEYKNLLSMEPNNVDCLRMLSNYYQQNQILSEDYEHVLQVLLQISPDSSEYQLGLCNFYLATKKYGDDEMNLFIRYLNNHDGDVSIREGLVRGLVASGDLLSALRECNEVLKLEPLRRSSHELLLICYRNLSMFDEALTRYSKLQNIYPEEPFFSDQVSLLEKEVATHRENVKVEKKEGKDFAHHYNRGVKLYSEGKYDEAISPLRAAFRAPKLKIHSGNLLVRSLLNLDQFDDADMVFKDLNIIGDAVDDEFILGLCYEMASEYAARGHNGTALSYYQYISKVNIDFKDVFQKIEDLQEDLKLQS